ncbi:MAG: GGDEF domain-containing protein [Armatimonadota bacterium]
MKDTSPVKQLTQHDGINSLMAEMQRLSDPLDMLAAVARCTPLEKVYMWVMLPVERGEQEIFVVSRYPWPQDNAQSLVDEFLMSARRTASDHEVDLPHADIVEVRYTCLNDEGRFAPINEPAIGHVGIVARQRLRAILRVYAAEDSEHLQEFAETVSHTVASYIDAALLARRNRIIENTRDCSGFLSREAFRQTLNQEIARIRKSPHEMALLRIKLVSRTEIMDASPVEETVAIARAMVESAVRHGDIVGELSGNDIGVLMPYTGPRNALIAAMRISDAFNSNEAVGAVFDHFIGLSGWSIAGSDAEGLLVETEQAARQAQYTSSGTVQLYM